MIELRVAKSTPKTNSCFPWTDTEWRQADVKNHRNSRTLLRLRSGHSHPFVHDHTEAYSRCPCGPPLTAEHALLHCNLAPALSVRRQQLFNSLREFTSFGEKPSLKQLLSALKRSFLQQRKHLRLVGQFAQKLPYPPSTLIAPPLSLLVLTS